MGAELPDPPRAVANSDPLAKPDEGPIQEVVLDPFFMSKYELTLGQWLRITGSNPSYFSATPVDSPYNYANPVDSVDWFQCEPALTRVGLQLPTEAQWEYAARGGTTTPWFVGEQPDDLYAHANLLENGAPHHLHVGSFEPNPFGLHDTAGNVWEWCRDVYGPYATSAGPGDGLRTPEGGGPYRTFRGGPFLSTPERARAALRYVVRPDTVAAMSVFVRPAPCF